VRPLLPGLHARFRACPDCPRASPEHHSRTVKDWMSDPISVRSPQSPPSTTLTTHTLILVARPIGLNASARTANSVTIAWSRPASRPFPTQYIIDQDGTAVTTVPGTTTSYDAIDLAPGTSYTYQVIAVRGSVHSAPSNTLITRTLTPPAWQSALDGQWTVNYAGIATNMSSINLTTDSWTLTAACAGSQCPLTVAGALNGSIFTATLRLSGRSYKGHAIDNDFISCDSNPVASTVTLTIEALNGEVAGSRWIATSWGGSMAVEAPATPKCSVGTLTADISATS
jgi:hypothetical protein